MFKFCLLSLLFIASSAQAVDEKLLAWDDHESGTGLRIFAKRVDQQYRPWIVRETQLKDTPFYQGLFSDVGVVKTMGNGSIKSPKKVAEYVKSGVDNFAKGVPSGRMTIEQDEEAVGYVHLGRYPKRPGVGHIERAFAPAVQGKGLGKAALGFIVKEWAPLVRKIGLQQDSEAPLPAIDKFRCFEGEALKLIYTTARPSNPASWKCYKYFDFYPSQPTETVSTISCEGWEGSQHGPLEQHIIDKYFSLTSVAQL
jgi:hypothetical protein